MEYNPIDKDKVTETPSTLPYAHHVGGFVIKPTDKGRIKGNAVEAMKQQTEMQLAQIYKQMELLAKQASELKQRMDISYEIYRADMNFRPNIGHHYFLYERANEKLVVSMVAPEEWGGKIPFAQFRAEVKLLSDHTWEIVRTEIKA